MEMINFVYKNKDLIKKAMVIFMIVFMLFGTFTMPYVTGYATNEAQKKIEGIGIEIYKLILGISTVIAVVAESIAACMYFFSANGRTVEQAGAWMKKIALGWIAINCMGIIVGLFTSLFGNNTWTGSKTPTP